MNGGFGIAFVVFADDQGENGGRHGGLNNNNASKLDRCAGEVFGDEDKEKGQDD